MVQGENNKKKYFRRAAHRATEKHLASSDIALTVGCPGRGCLPILGRKFPATVARLVIV